LAGSSRSIKLLIVFLILGALSTFIPTGYVLISPGSAEDLRELVAVEGSRQDQGKFFLVTVSQQQANIPMAIYGLLHPHIELQPLSHIIPQGMDRETYRQLMKEWMTESQLLAQVVALQRSGYQVEIESDGVVIVKLLPDSPSTNILEKDDIIVAVDGTPVYLADQVVSAVQSRKVGDEVTLTVIREGETLERTVKTGPHRDDPSLAALGILIRTLDWKPVLPLEIHMRTGDIGGPSAGVMFVLEIINQIKPQDITGGHLIAGTGTIDLNEKVGPIGGVYQKVIAAEKAGAEYFIVPRENYEEAREAARRVKLVPVTNLQEALNFLETLEPLPTQEALPGAGEQSPAA